MSSVAILMAGTTEKWLAVKANPAASELRLLNRLNTLFDKAAVEATRAVRGREGANKIGQILRSLERDMGGKIWNESSKFAATPLAKEALRGKSFEASRRTMARVTGNVMKNLDDSFRSGVGMDQTAVNLRDTFKGMRDSELRTVARTETHGAQMSERFKQHQASALVDYHQWLSAFDEATRETHIDMDGQIARVGEPFSNGLLHPGDTSGDIEEWINCRCRVVPWLMPAGKISPAGKSISGEIAEMALKYFYEAELVDIGRPKKKKLKKEFKTTKDYMKSLSQKDQTLTKKAVNTYAGGVTKFREMIKFQQQGLRPRMVAGKIPEKVKNLEKLIENAGTFKGTLYRGMAVSEEQLGQFLSTVKTGNIVQTDSFMSASKAKKWAQKFAEGMSLTEKDLSRADYSIIIKIKAKKGLDINEFTGTLQDIKEVVSNAKTKYKVIGVKRSAGNPTLQIRNTYNVSLEEIS